MDKMGHFIANKTQLYGQKNIRQLLVFIYLTRQP